MEIVQAVKTLNSISWQQLNFPRRPILSTILYRNPNISEQLQCLIWPIFLRIFYALFTQDAPLLFLYHGVKSRRWPKTQIKGSSLKTIGTLYIYLVHKTQGKKRALNEKINNQLTLAVAVKVKQKKKAWTQNQTQYMNRHCQRASWSIVQTNSKRTIRDRKACLWAFNKK